MTFLARLERHAIAAAISYRLSAVSFAQEGVSDV
jgi:hypothetical protein